MILQLSAEKTIREIAMEKYLILPGVLKLSSCSDIWAFYLP
jgi:hypothetical protein